MISRSVSCWIHLIDKSRFCLTAKLVFCFVFWFSRLLPRVVFELMLYPCELYPLWKFNWEVQMCILCIVSGFRNRPKSDLSRNPQYCYFSLIFFAVLDSTDKYLKDGAAQFCSKNRQTCRIRNRICGIANTLWNPQTNNKTCVLLNWAVAESANCKWNPQFLIGIRILFADPVYI